MAKVLISEKIKACGISKLDLAGHEVMQLETSSAEELKEKLKEADALLVGDFPVTRQMMETAPCLKIISSCGNKAGRIDLRAAKALGIAVTVPLDAESISMAEYTAAIMLVLAKNLLPILEKSSKIEAMRLSEKEGVELSRKTLGLIGCGKIGFRLAVICRMGFGMRVLVYDPYIKKIPEGVEVTADRDSVFREADFLSIQCYLSDATFHSVGEREFGLMKKTAYFINTAEMEVVEESALIEALSNGRIAGAGLDIAEPEALSPESCLYRLPNVITTALLGAATVEAATRTSSIAAENIIQFFKGGYIEGRLV